MTEERASSWSDPLIKSKKEAAINSPAPKDIKAAVIRWLIFSLRDRIAPIGKQSATSALNHRISVMPVIALLNSV
jgi:hypothetical protein